MKIRQKIATGFVTLAILAGSYFGVKTIHSRGYESGRQQGRQEIKNKMWEEGKIQVRNWEDDMKDIWHQINRDSTPIPERTRLHREYGLVQEKSYDLITLMSRVSNDNYSINGAR